MPHCLEASIASELWRWAFATPNERAGITAPQSSLSVKLEFYLCDVFDLIVLTRSRGIWCDGVVELSIVRIGRLAFRVVGAGYFPGNLSAFEIEFHFAQHRSCLVRRIIFRFGLARHGGGIREPREKDVARIVANRPTRDEEWAVAVEITPIVA